MTRAGPAQSSAPPDADPRRWRTLAVCLVGGFMVMLDVSIVNVALPSIQAGLQAPTSDLQWVVSGYALTFGLLLVPAGRIGDVRGRRTMFVVALGLFTAASAICGAAPTSLVLVLARLAQGLAGGTLMPQITAIIQEMFSGRERGKAFGLFGTMVGVSTAVGPLLGGLLIQAFGDTEGWRAVFYVNIPIGLCAIPFAWRLLPQHPHSVTERRDLDPVGVGMLGAAAVVLLLPFVQERVWGSWKWWLVPAAAGLAAGFIAWERRYRAHGREPLVELDLYRLPSYAYGSALITLYFAGFTPLFFVTTLYLQTGLQYSALAAGLALTPFALGTAVGSSIGGRHVHDRGRPLVVGGLVLVIIGLVGAEIAVHAVPTNGTGWALLAPLLVGGLGSGFVIAPNQALTLADVPLARAGTAGGLLQTGQRVGAAVGIAAIGASFFATVANSRGDFADAFQHGIVIALAFIGAALVVGLVEVSRRPNHGRPSHRRTYRREAKTYT